MEIYDLITNYLNDEKDAMIPLITWFLNRVMEQEALEQTGAERYERTDCRKARRNGYRKRTLTSRYGELELEKPQIREIPFETKVFEKYSRTEKAIENAIAESYIQGVSTRKVENIVAELGVENISKSRVSRIAKELDEKVYEFINKPIEQKMKYLYVDATYFKIREGARYLNKPMFIVAGVNEDGYREVLGVRIADSEDAMFWQDFFSELKQRGLDGVELVISDGHKGIQKAIEKSFIAASWQMCHVHFMRAVLSKVPKSTINK